MKYQSQAPISSSLYATSCDALRRFWRGGSGLPVPVLMAVCLLAVSGITDAFEPTITKLHGRSKSGLAGINVGTSTAISDRYLLSGSPFSDDVADDAGSVQVYDARTGRFLRTLTAADGEADDQLGYGVAICGNLGLVGAHAADATGANSGAAYVFDLRNGRQIAKLLPDAGSSDNNFAYSVAISGDLALIGAAQDDDIAANSGAAYLFNVKTGDLVLKLKADDASATAFFGEGVALCGNLALIGADREDSGGVDAGAAYLFDVGTGDQVLKLQPNDPAPGNVFGWPVALSGNYALVGAIQGDGAAVNSGAVYVFEVGTGQQIAKLTAPDGAANDQFGWDLAVEGNLALVGAWTHDGVDNDSGAAYLFDIPSQSLLAKLTPPDATYDQRFGSAVAICENRAVVGALWDDDQGSESGAVYLYRNVSGPLSLTTVAKRGDFAPKLVNSDFLSFRDAFINDDGETAFYAAATARGRGVWTDLPGGLDTRTRSGQNLSPLGGNFTGVSVANAFSPIVEHSDNAIVRVTLRGTGVNGTNNQAVIQSSGNMNQALLRTGEPMGDLGGARMQRFVEVVHQSHAGDIATAYQLRKGGGVTPGNDTGVYVTDNFGLIIDSGVQEGARNREGSEVPYFAGTHTYGQFFGRVCYTKTGEFVFPAYHVEDATGKSLQGLFRDSDDDSPLDVAIQGNPADYLIDAEFRAFLGETINDAYLFRATMTGSGVSGATNEALWSGQGFVAIRKGEAPDPAAPNEVVSRILGFWAVNSAKDIVVLAKLRGPGVNARNDCALYLYRDSGSSLQELIREGDEVCGSDCPKLGTIQRVDVDNGNGNYVVLASLIGPAGSNQGILTGNMTSGNNTNQKILRQPFLKLRKGTSFQAATGESTTIKSFVLPVTTDKGGAGAKGLGQVINEAGEIAVCIQFNNRAKQIVKGIP